MFAVEQRRGLHAIYIIPNEFNSFSTELDLILTLRLESPCYGSNKLLMPNRYA